MDDYKVIKYSITKEADRKLFPIVKDLAEKYKERYLRTEKDSILYLDQTEGVVYVYSLGAPSAEETSRDLSMSEKGATWFREMRGEGVAEDGIKAANTWQTLITRLSETFYKNNSVLYYEDTDTDFNMGGDIESEIKAMVNVFFDEKNVRVVKESGNSTQLIYAASLRLAMGISLVPQPVLGKLYFSLNSDGSLKFLTKEEASKLEDILKRAQSKEGATPPEDTDVGVIVETLRGMLEDKEHLERFLVFNASNQAVMDKMTEKLRMEKREDALPVEILKVTINTILLMKVKATAFDVYFERFTNVKTPVLRAKVLFDKVTLSCEACKEHEELITSNVIDYVTSSGKAASAEVVCNNGEIDLRVNGKLLVAAEYEDALADIKKSVFEKHLRRVECSSCAARDACVGYVCEEKQLPVKDIDRDGEISSVIRCADCVYPESYVYVNGEAYTTSSVFYDVNERGLRLRSDEKGGRTTCSVCGRAYYRERGSLDELCDLCASLGSGDEAQQRKQKALYDKYSGLLPLHKRLASPKRCAEDQSVIVFKVGENYHVFDKLAAIIAGEEHLTGRSVTPDGNGEV